MNYQKARELYEEIVPQADQEGIAVGVARHGASGTYHVWAAFPAPESAKATIKDQAVQWTIRSLANWYFFMHRLREKRTRESP